MTNHSTLEANRMSKHACTRSQQRGIGLDVIHLIYTQHDQEEHAGDGCYKLRLSKQASKELAGYGFASTLLERAKGVVVLVNKHDHIVTVMHDVPSRKRPSRLPLGKFVNARNPFVLGYYHG